MSLQCRLCVFKVSKSAVRRVVYLADCVCLPVQVGSRGHCSVEDALAALDLYKLVEGEWEQELQDKLRDDDAPHPPSFASSNHYMLDEYWPDDVTVDGQ